MLKWIKEMFSKKWFLGLLALVILVGAVVSGAHYYRYRQVTRMLNSPSYQAAAGILNLEQYPRLALSKDQAQKLLPVVQQLVLNPNPASDKAGQLAKNMLGVLTPEQAEFIKYTQPGKYLYPGAGLKQDTVEKNTYRQPPIDGMKKWGRLDGGRDDRGRGDDSRGRGDDGRGWQKNRRGGWGHRMGPWKAGGSAVYETLRQQLLQKVYG